jgi:hypothetical protein
MPGLPGTIQPTAWTPVRAELERVLADGQWHPKQELFQRVRIFVDPRLAARAWCRSYNRNTFRFRRLRFRPEGTTEDRPSASVAFAYREEKYLEVGRRMIFDQQMQQLVVRKRLERTGPLRARRFRLLGAPARHTIEGERDLAAVVVDADRLVRGDSLSGDRIQPLVPLAAG